MDTTHHCLTTPLGGIPSEFLEETCNAKTREMGLLYSENCMILTSTVFDWSTRVTDRQSDRQTDGFAIAYSALSMLSRAKNPIIKTVNIKNVGNIPFGWYVKLKAGLSCTETDLNDTKIPFPATSTTRLGLWLDVNRPIRRSVAVVPSRISTYSPEKRWKEWKRSWIGWLDLTEKDEVHPWQPEVGQLSRDASQPVTSLSHHWLQGCVTMSINSNSPISVPRKNLKPYLWTTVTAKIISSLNPNPHTWQSKFELTAHVSHQSPWLSSHRQISRLF